MSYSQGTTCMVTHCCLSNDMLYFSVGWNHDCHDMHGYTLLLVMICCIFQLDGITTVRHVWLHILKKNILLHFYFIQPGENIMSKRKYTYKMEEVVCQTCLNRRVFYKHNHVGWNHDCHDMHGYTLLLVMICCIFQLDGITTVRHVWLHIVGIFFSKGSKKP
jgi:hypothetical protein